MMVNKVTQKNTVLTVMALSSETAIMPTVGNDGSAPSASIPSAGAILRLDVSTSRSGSGVGLSKAIRSDSWPIKVDTVRGSFTA